MHLLPENHQLIAGPAGNIELTVDKPKENKHPNTTVIICHPHPQHLGTMHNKVVTTISRTAKELGLTSIRFNYRGVQHSQGSYDHGEGEVEDLLTVVNWVQTQTPEQKIILAGFSFGGSVAYKGAAKIEHLSHLITIAPAVVNFPLTQHPEPTVPWLIIQGNNDEVVASEAVFHWLTTEVSCPYTLSKMQETGHFFHGKLVYLRKEIEYYLQPRLS